MACSGDTKFGPALASGADIRCRSFDFTNTFEASFFALVPSILIIPVIAYRSWSIFQRSKVVDWFLALSVKPTLYFALAVLQLAKLSLYASKNEPNASALEVPASAFVLFAIINLSFLSWLEHSRTPSPSPIIQAYLLLTLLFDMMRLRTRWLLSDDTGIASLQSAGLALKVLLLIVESLSKTSHIVALSKSRFSPEDKAGFFSRSLLWWLNPLFLLGYREKLSNDDLYPIDVALGSAKLTDLLFAAWNRSASAREHRLAVALVKAFWKQILIIQFPRLALVGFALAQPFLIQASISFIANHALRPVEYGYGLIGAFAMVYIGVAISTLWYQHLTFRFLTMVRGSLVGLIFKHSLTIPVSESGGASEAVSLMSTDMERIQQTLQWVMNIGPNVVQVGLGLWILDRYLGAVIVAPALITILCAVMSGQVGKWIPPRQRRWMQAIQRRVGVTTNAIDDIKGVKISGLSQQVGDQIQDCRVSEITDQKAFRRLQITNITLGNVPSMITPAVTFTAFAIVRLVSGGNQFQVETAFTSLAFIAILTNPVGELVAATTNLASALSCLDRIEQFLQTRSQQDCRSVLPSDHATLNSNSHENDSDASKSRIVPKPRTSTGLHSTSKAYISISDGSFGWDMENPILRDINLEIMPAMLTIVIGPVGSGKSTLLQSLLGETPIISGTINCSSPKNIAYCDQTAWILNMSIKQNILGASGYNEERYREVVAACQLDDDFESMPVGDETLTGSKGVSLSGGQKQRIALARAAYSGKQLVILDDTFSGLDATTSLRCFNALLEASGMLRSEGRAVILATHNVQWLPHADEIIVLGDGGRISAKGDFNTLRLSNAYVRNIVDSQQTVKQASSQVDSAETVSNVATSLVVPMSKTSKDLAQRDISEGETAQTTKIGAFRYYLSSMGRKTVCGYAAFVLFQTGCSAAQPLWLKHWVAENQKNPDQGIGLWVGVYMVFALGQIMFIALGTGYFLLLVIPKSSKNIHRKLLAATMSAPMSFFVAQDTGVIVNHFTSDLNLVDLALPISFILTSQKLLATIAEIVLTCVASGYLATAIPFLAATLYILQRIYLKTSRQLRSLDLELKASLFSHFLATNSGLGTIRAFSWTSIVEQENTELLDMSQRPHYLLFCLQRWLTLVLDLVTGGMATLLMGLAVALRDEMDPGYLGVALVSVMGFGHIVSMLILSWTNLETSLQAVERIRKYVASTPVELESSGNNEHEETPDLDKWPSIGEVVIENMSSSYGDLKVLNNIDLSFAAGSKIAICGRTGSGKSSLLGLLLRMYEPDAGSIIIDNQNIASIPPSQVRSSIIALSQDPMFLTGTVRFNLDPYGAHAINDEKLWDVLTKTELKLLVEEKGGLDAAMVIDGFSAGQRQLFCLARVMLRSGRVLLLDEATSSLDTQSEYLVNELIRSEFREWTVIVVTHRLKAVAAPDSGFDQVVVLDKGRVVEKGTPEELLKREGQSVFSQMVEI